MLSAQDQRGEKSVDRGFRSVHIGEVVSDNNPVAPCFLSAIQRFIGPFQQRFAVCFVIWETESPMEIIGLSNRSSRAAAPSNPWGDDAAITDR